MSAKRNLLFISPVAPDTARNGLAMRAGMVLEALAQDFCVYLLTASLSPGGGPTSISLIERCCEDWKVLQPLPLPGGLRSVLATALNRRPQQVRKLEPLIEEAAAAFPGVTFDVVHVFRLYCAVLAESYLGAVPRPEMQIDVDDIESVALSRLAALLPGLGEQGLANDIAREARRFAAYEAKMLPRFDRVYACSEVDAARLRKRHPGASVRVLPNAVRRPQTVGDRRSDGVFRLLFVGTLGYYPNEDAVRWFATDVLPLLRTEVGAIEFVVVGAGRVPSGLDSLPGVRLVGEVDDLAPQYAEADVVVVPLRSGGGTRIKAIEAFAYHRPVVSTTVGIEGIDAAHEVHALIADSAADFAAQCLRLRDDGVLRARLVENAGRLAESEYSLDAVLAALRRGSTQAP